MTLTTVNEEDGWFGGLVATSRFGGKQLELSVGGLDEFSKDMCRKRMELWLLRPSEAEEGVNDFHGFVRRRDRPQFERRQSTLACNEPELLKPFYARLCAGSVVARIWTTRTSIILGASLPSCLIFPVAVATKGLW
jgi:hypothetical protein